jgi:hypothetical protein
MADNKNKQEDFSKVEYMHIMKDRIPCSLTDSYKELKSGDTIFIQAKSSEATPFDRQHVIRFVEEAGTKIKSSFKPTEEVEWKNRFIKQYEILRGAGTTKKKFKTLIKEHNIDKVYQKEINLYIRKLKDDPNNYQKAQNNASLYYPTIYRVEHGRLDDEIINNWFAQLQTIVDVVNEEEKGKETNTMEKKKEALFFQSFFYTKKGNQTEFEVNAFAKSNSTRSKIIEIQKEMKNYERFIIPYNQGENHWVLIVLKRVKQDENPHALSDSIKFSMTWMDPLGASETTAEQEANFFREAFNKRFGPKEEGTQNNQSQGNQDKQNEEDDEDKNNKDKNKDGEDQKEYTLEINRNGIQYSDCIQKDVINCGVYTCIFALNEIDRLLAKQDDDNKTKKSKTEKEEPEPKEDDNETKEIAEKINSLLVPEDSLYLWRLFLKYRVFEEY